MPAIIQQLLQGQEVRLGDLRPTRTFIYVDDVVEGALRMASAEGLEGELIHFGGPEVVSMGELLDLVSEAMDRPYTLIQDPSRMRPAKSEIYRQEVDCAKALRLLNWRPETRLAEGLKATIAWMAEGGYADQ